MLSLMLLVVKLRGKLGNNIRSCFDLIRKLIPSTGVIAQRLKLSTQTPLGEWKIVVTAGVSRVHSSFYTCNHI